MKKFVEYVDGNKVVSLDMLETVVMGVRFDVVQVILNGQNNFAVWLVPNDKSKEPEFIGASMNMRGARRMIWSHISMETLKAISEIVLR